VTVPAPRSLQRPSALRAGDRVAVLSASSTASQQRLAVGMDTLRLAGLRPVSYPTAETIGAFRSYLAGDDALRAGDLRSALLDPDIAGILFATGGSGAQRTLAAMDWTGLSELRPKVLAGFSDVTAVLEAVAVRLHWSSLLAPMVEQVGSGDPYSFASLARTLMQPERATEIRYADGVAAVGGTAPGVTAGGCLTLLTSSIGTDTCWPARGAILVLEEETEDDYRIDRMLTQLRRSGYLDGVAGIITGTWTNCGDRATIEAILTERLGDLGVPMLMRADVGHGGHFQTFPIGVAAELDADAGILRLLDPPLIPAPGQP
jgi:muramoyltetrapeptide carboxypeptidase